MKTLRASFEYYAVDFAAFLIEKQKARGNWRHKLGGFLLAELGIILTAVGISSVYRGEHTLFLMLATATFWLGLDIPRLLYSATTLRRAPGWRLLRILRWVFSSRTVKSAFEPGIKDMQFEHFQALHEGKPLKAGWVQVRGYFSVWSAVLAQTPISIARGIYKMW